MTRLRFRASNMERRYICPGSAHLESGIPETDSDQAKEGRLLHGYAGNSKLDRSVLSPVHRDLLRISDDLDRQIFDRVRERFKVSDNEPFEDATEKELFVEGSNISISGHCDLSRYWPARRLMVVIDRKFGFRQVSPASANYQLRTYAVGAANDRECETVIVGITQPRLSYSERITLAEYSKADIEAARSELLSIATSCLREDAKLIPTEDGCRYCRAQLICQPYIDKFALSPVDKEKLALCSDDQLDMILVAIQFAEFIKDQARDEARLRIKAGGMTHYKLGKESEMRNIADPKRAFSLLQLRGDLTRDEIFDCSKMVIGRLEERLREKNKLSAKAAKELINETLASVIEKIPKEPPLIRLKDKPKAITQGEKQ